MNIEELEKLLEPPTLRLRDLKIGDRFRFTEISGWNTYDIFEIDRYTIKNGKTTITLTTGSIIHEANPQVKIIK